MEKKRCTSIVGWVKRDAGTIYVGFAYLNEPQQLEIETKLANPTGLVADCQLNPTYDLSFRTIVTVEEEQGPFIVLFAVTQHIFACYGLKSLNPEYWMT